MPKNVQTKVLQKNLKRILGLSKKNISLKQNHDGSYRLKLNDLSKETLEQIINIQASHLDSSNHLDQPNLSATNTPTIEKTPVVVNNEEITLPAQFNDLPLPCMCLHCDLNRDLDLLINQQKEFQKYIQENPLPKSLKPTQKSLIRLKKKMKFQRKQQLNILNKLGHAFSIKLMRLESLKSPMHASYPNVQPTIKPQTVRYTSSNRKRVEITIPTNCLKQIAQTEQSSVRS